MKAPPRNLIIARGWGRLGAGGIIKQDSTSVYVLLTLILLPLRLYTLETNFVVAAATILGLRGGDAVRNWEHLFNIPRGYLNPPNPDRFLVVFQANMHLKSEPTTEEAKEVASSISECLANQFEYCKPAFHFFIFFFSNGLAY